MLLQIDTLYLMISSEEKEIENSVCHYPVTQFWGVEVEFKPFWTVTKCDWSKGGGRCVVRLL